MPADNETVAADGQGEGEPTSLRDKLMDRRTLIAGAAGIGALGIGGFFALNGGGGSSTPVASGSPRGSASATPSRTRTTTRSTSTRTTSAAPSTTATTAPTTSAATSSAPPTSTRPPTTTRPTSTSPPPPPPPPTSTTTNPPSTTPPPPPPPKNLRAFVGEDDGDSIGMVDEAGNNVRNLDAGAYTITVNDYSKYHNFHLYGPSVDKTTTVEEVGVVTWNVTLQSGRYDYVCDPHAEFMKGNFTVR